MKTSTRFLSLFLALVLILSAVPMTVSAKGSIITGIAYVNASSLRLRSQASTSSTIVDTAARGEIVVVLGKQGDWYKVIYDMQEGYMHGAYLNIKTTENVELGYGVINGTSVNLRSGAGTSYKVVTQGNTGDKAYIIGVSNGWYKVIYGENICYIRSDYLDLTEAPYENNSSTKAPLFFKGGNSTGVTVSASALNGSTGSSSASSSESAGSSNSGSTTENTSSSGTSTATSAGIKYGMAFVTGSNLRMRAEANTSSKILDTAAKGEVVVVLEKVGDWYKVIYNLKEGYMHGNYLNVKTVENVELGYGTFNANAVNLRSGAGTSNSVVATASKGDKAYIVGINNGWYKVIYGENIGYIRSDYLDLTEAPYENKASSKSPLFFRGGISTGTPVSAAALNGTSGSTTSGNSSSSTSTGSSASGSLIVETAKKYLGVPYVWGGTSPSGFDCSGLVYYVLRSCGISASRTLATMYQQGTPVEKSQLQPGDIVFFQNTYKSGISHVGIYVGDGKFIHSPHSGQVVSYADLYSDYYVSHYYGAVRFS